MLMPSVLRPAILVAGTVAALATPALAQSNACASATPIPVPGSYSGTTVGSVSATVMPSSCRVAGDQADDQHNRNEHQRTCPRLRVL